MSDALRSLHIPDVLPGALGHTGNPFFFTGEFLPTFWAAPGAVDDVAQAAVGIDHPHAFMAVRAAHIRAVLRRNSQEKQLPAGPGAPTAAGRALAGWSPWQVCPNNPLQRIVGHLWASYGVVCAATWTATQPCDRRVKSSDDLSVLAKTSGRSRNHTRAAYSPSALSFSSPATHPLR